MKCIFSSPSSFSFSNVIIFHMHVCSSRCTICIDITFILSLKITFHSISVSQTPSSALSVTIGKEQQSSRIRRRCTSYSSILTIHTIDRIFSSLPSLVHTFLQMAIFSRVREFFCFFFFFFFFFFSQSPLSSSSSSSYHHHHQLKNKNNIHPRN